LARRAEVSRAVGATHVICNPAGHMTDAAVAAEVARITDGRLADVVIEAIGHQEQAFNLCIDLCGKGGSIMYFGVPPETIDGLKFRELYFKNATVYTSVNPDFRRDFPLAMQWISEGRIDLSALATHRFGLADIQAAYETFRDRKDGAVKVLLDFA
jgi:alcohol dehydrogenase